MEPTATALAERYILMRADYEQRNYEYLYEYCTPIACVGKGRYAIEIVRVEGYDEDRAQFSATYQAMRLASGMEHRGGWENGQPMVYHTFEQALDAAVAFAAVLRPAIGFDIWGRRIVNNTEGGSDG